MLFKKQQQKLRTYYSSKLLCYRSALYTVPPGFLQTIIALLSALLSVPTISVLSWMVEHAFFSTTAFGWEAFGELALPLGACLCAAIVFLSRNPMHALLSLLGVFFATTLMYLMAGIAFVGLVFLIVYVGAVAVLFLFVIMLLNVKSLTSRDELIRHPSQVAAIFCAALLLQQTHQHIVSSTEQSVSDSFIRDASVEPTTGDAVFFYVRVIATDINALTGLYTIHAILFLITTIILLAALLGAIILATVTTERATAIADIRAYSAKRTFQKTTLFSIVVLFFISEVALSSLLQLFGDKIDDFLVPASLCAYRISDYVPRLLNQRHKSMRRPRRLITDGRYEIFDSRIHPSHFVVRARATLCSQSVYKKLLKKLTAGKATPYTVRFLCRRPKVFRLHAAAALAPVQRKLLRYRDVGVIVRRRWLWHWRRDRATSLLRLDRALLPVIFDGRAELAGLDPRKDRKAERIARVASYYDWWVPGVPTWYPWRAGDVVQGVRFYFYEKWLISQRAIRFRWSPFRYLRFRVVTRYMPPVLFWAWRVRAFCILFFFYFFATAIFTAIVYAFIEDYPTIGSNLADVYRGIHKTWYMTSKPTPSQHFFAGVLLLPAALLVWTLKFTPYILLISILFAYDTVMMHTGQVSNFEFHEARCNYWRVEGWREVKVVLDEQRAVALARSKFHPDKGRIDVPPFYPHWFMEAIFDKPEWFAKIMYFYYDNWYEVWLATTKGIKYIQHTQAYRCLTAYVRNLLLSLPEKFPFLTECCREITRFFSAAVLVIEENLWDPFVQIFYQYTCYPRWLRWIICWIDHSGGTMIAYAFFSAGLLYGVSCLILCAQWRRMYYRIRIRRPSVLLALLITFFWLGFLATVWYSLEEIHVMNFKSDLYSLMRAYNRSWHEWFKFLLFFIRHLNGSLATLYLLYGWDQYWTSPNDEPRREFERHEPVTLRAYVNRFIRLRGMFSPNLPTIWKEKQRPGESAIKTYGRASAKDIAEAYEEYRTEQAKLLHFNIVMHTYFPTFYDRHTEKLFQEYRWPDVFFSDKHHGNSFYD